MQEGSSDFLRGPTETAPAPPYQQQEGPLQLQGIWKGLSSPLLYFARDDPSCSLKFNISGFIPTVVQLTADEVNPFSQITVSLHPEKSLLPSKAWTTTAPQGSRSSQQSPISARREGGPRGSDLQVSPPTGRMSCLHSPSPLSPSSGSRQSCVAAVMVRPRKACFWKAACSQRSLQNARRGACWTPRTLSAAPAEGRSGCGHPLTPSVPHT